MMNFELGQTDTLGFFFAILLTFLKIMAISVFVYCLFPMIFAKARKASITKGRYVLICYEINLIGFAILTVINGLISFVPYVFWTWIFTNIGVGILKNNNHIKTGEQKENTAVQIIILMCIIILVAFLSILLSQL